MTNIKGTLPFVLILGLTAGSTAAYAQALDADVTGTSTLCAEGDADCIEALGAGDGPTLNTGTDTTLDAGIETELDSDLATDSDVAPAADLDGAVTAESDGSLTPVEGETDVAGTGNASTTEDGLVLNGIHSLASSQDLVGVNVYDSEDNRVGEISAVLPADAENSEERVVIGMGGFLGFGQKPVAIPASSLQVATDVDGDIDRVVTSHTQAELDALPEVEM